MSEDAHHFKTGAVRSADRDEERWDLITPIGLKALARTCAEGAVKRGDFNWENGMPVTDLLNHAIGHIYDFLSGDRAEDHLGHAAWNVLGAIHSLEKWPHLNDGFLRGPGCECPPAAVKSDDSSEKISLLHPDEIRQRLAMLARESVSAKTTP